MTMDVDLTAELPLGTKLTISGLAFGPQYEHGVTTACEPGCETVMRVTRIYDGGATLERVTPKPPCIKPGPKVANSYGPPRRGRLG